MKKEFEITQAELDTILDASKPVPLIMLQLGMPRSPQERANGAWSELGKKLGFAYMSVEPIQGKSQRFFLATPVKTKGA